LLVEQTGNVHPVLDILDAINVQHTCVLANRKGSRSPGRLYFSCQLQT
jgi:hypothetical protein